VNNNLNLASRPFNNRVLPWILTLVILFVSLVGLVLVVQLTTSINRDVALKEAALNKMKQEEQALMVKGETLKNQFTSQQQQALQAAHQLVERKGFSWSRLFADLEGALPPSVRVSRIAVRDVTKQGDQTVAELDLAVFSKSSSTIIEMISSMDKTGIFHANLVSQNLQKGRGEAGTEYDLFVVYRPRQGFVSESLAEAQEQTTGDAK
jgi:cell division protein FtsB